MPPTTIGIVANIYNEIHALPGWLETHLPFADDVRILHAGPQGEYSTDGTIELLEKWGIPIEFCAIDDGFGAVRSRAVRMSPCDWVILLDADERFFPLHRVLNCSGRSTPPGDVDDILRGYDPRQDGVSPDWSKIAALGQHLKVDIGPVYDQGARLRELLSCNPQLDAVATARRHWHDFSLQRPTQNWQVEPDWQMRVVRNVQHVYFDPETRMHERLLGARNVHLGDMERGPFIDHFHFAMKKLERDQRAHDVSTYDAIHKGEVPPTYDEHKRGSSR